jgi:hypothetical protein
MTEERMKVVFMGVLIGTASGWDEIDTQVIAFYEFEPDEKAKNFVGLSGVLTINGTEGTMEICEEGEEEPICSLEQVEVLQMLLDIAKAGE